MAISFFSQTDMTGTGLYSCVQPLTKTLHVKFNKRKPETGDGVE